MKRLSISALLLSLLVTACGGGNGNPATPTPPAAPLRGDLVSSSLLVQYSTNVITNATDNYYGLTATYPVKNYKIVYKTLDANGNLIDASGLLTIPTKNPAGASPLMLFNHGTIFEDTTAPSNSATTDHLSSLIASQDYIVMMPDYVGYATSSQLLHPYVHASTLASTDVDMIRASKKWLTQQSIPTNAKLFIAGYSEGGYATMAAHKEIQTNLSTEMTVTASMPAGGPYDMINTARHFLVDTTDLVYSPYIAFVFKAYDTAYSWNRISSFFQSAYVTPVNTLFDGNHSGTYISGQLTNARDNLFNAQFLSDFAGSSETIVKARLAENNIYDWAPTNPLRLYHGNNDTVVPTANANTAEAAMTTNGGNVSKTLCSTGAGNHSDCFVPYITAMLNYFAGL